LDQAGNLYGTTYQGGTNRNGEIQYGGGVVFEYAAGTGQFTVLYDFCNQTLCTDGATPDRVKLVVDTAGNLYGTTSKGGNSSGGGVVFEVVHGQAGWTENILYTFCRNENSGCKDGGSSHEGLTYAGAAGGQTYDGTSPLYGTTEGGGANGNGTLFALTPENGGTKWKERVLYSFCSQNNCTDGRNPNTPLFLDSLGNFYGTTPYGGQFAQGTVFEITPNGTAYSESVLYSFCAQSQCVDGENPFSGVVMDGAGNLFGTTDYGGSVAKGALFELSPNGSQWTYNVLQSFDGSDGEFPYSDLIIDADGNLFGTTAQGGAHERKSGTVFEFNGGLQTLYSFCSLSKCADGKLPLGGVIEDSTGNLFGLTSGNVHDRDSTLYELSP